MKNKVLNGLLGFALVLLLWQLGSMALQKPFLPTPGASFAAFFEFLFYGEMGRHFLISSGRILCSILLAVVLAVRILLKAPLASLFGGHNLADAVRYFAVVVTAGCLWPLTFRFFARRGVEEKVDQ